ncbi:hypothetical protein L1286_12965 [Pseudoalteromonas sp. SMS1]|uniref:hypothetical protein n=1 Tax=Pseudoalteromonas sp. SMS1 TaxID=2908894 RepID=UPI001F1CE1E9|nr:hypothetical protein [Pseudoalteromonas sp. SMS1]MCF2858392.1 hypothetical protein [Pseudoalteromonas sp. SMS1]
MKGFIAFVLLLLVTHPSAAKVIFSQDKECQTLQDCIYLAEEKKSYVHIPSGIHTVLGDIEVRGVNIKGEGNSSILRFENSSFYPIKLKDAYLEDVKVLYAGVQN